MIYTVQLTTKEKEAILTALSEKLFSLPANSPARATYQETINRTSQTILSHDKTRVQTINARAKKTSQTRPTNCRRLYYPQRFTNLIYHHF